MAGVPGYKDMVASIASGAPSPPSPGGAPVNVGSALGAPPPTGAGAFPLGSSDALSPRAAASATIDQLAGLKSHFPNAGDRIDGMIAELTSLAKVDGPSPSGLQPPPKMPPPVPPPPVPAPASAGVAAAQIPPPPLGGALPLPPM